MNFSEKVTRKNYRMKLCAMGINALGALALIIGLIYVISIDVIKSPLVSIMAMDDVWIRCLGTMSYDIAYTGIVLMTLGTLFKMRAEDSQKALENTNRFSSNS